MHAREHDNGAGGSALPPRPSSAEEIAGLVAGARADLEHLGGVYDRPGRAPEPHRTEWLGRRQLVAAWDAGRIAGQVPRFRKGLELVWTPAAATCADYTLARDLSVLVSRGVELPDVKPVLECDYAALPLEELAGEVLDLVRRLELGPEEPDGLRRLYRTALLLYAQGHTFPRATEEERDRAVWRLCDRYARRWNTSSQKAGGISPDARDTLEDRQAELGGDRREAKRQALAVGLLEAVESRGEARRIRLGQQYVYRDGELAELRPLGLRGSEHVLHRDEGRLETVDGLRALDRHLRRRAIEAAERHLEDRKPGALLADVPDGVEPGVLPLDDSLLEDPGLDEPLFQAPAVLDAAEEDHPARWSSVEDTATDRQRRYLRLARDLVSRGSTPEKALREAAVRLYPDLPRNRALANARALRNRLRARVGISA